MAGHVEIVLNGDVPAAIAGPAQVEGLALERALLHLHQALRHVRTDVGRELLVAKDQRQHVDQAQVADVDGDAGALGHVRAGLAAAQLGLVCDVVVDERGTLEVLDGRRRGERGGGVSAHGLAAQKGQRGARALAARGGEALKRLVEVAVEVRARGFGSAGHAGGCALGQKRLNLGALLAKVCGKQGAGGA